MTPLLFLIIVTGTAVAPIFCVVLCGLLVHHGIWSLEWAVPVLWSVVALRYAVLRRRSRGQQAGPGPLGSLVLVLSLLLGGLWAAHLFHDVLSPGGRWICAGVLVTLAVVWLGRVERWMPAPAGQLLGALPRPASFPRGTRRVAAALVVMPFWPAQPVKLLGALEAEAALQGLELDPKSVRPGEVAKAGLRSIFGAQRVLLRARVPGSPYDVFLARLMFDHEGRPARVTGLFNLSQTAAADEVGLVRRGVWAAWRVVIGDETRSVEIGDLNGEGIASGPGWDFVGQLQRRMTNIQQTGQARGVGRASISGKFPPSSKLTLQSGVLTWGEGRPGERLELGREPEPEFSEEHYVLTSLPPARPGDLTTWAVDRLRAVSFIGNGGMQWLKGVAFWASAKAEDLHAEVIGVDAEETIAEELGDVVERLPIVRHSDIPHWPPEPLTPVILPALPAEGKWVDLGRDPLLGGTEAGRGAMLLTFIRVDPKRSYNQVSITLWDPRRIQLAIVAGTEEPRSTLGRQGTGLIPRDPRVLRRLVGAFNGAFQAVHGEFGMMESGVVQLPPKPYAATVATFSDGGVALGTWPALPTKIPVEMVGLRQNMTPLVAGGSPNPYGRHWWGGVPEGWKEEARTVRSGLCLTQEGYLGYFYSPSIDPDRLAQAMIRARCQYGIHLDMNAGHAGLEFYKVAPEDELPNLGRALDPAWEATAQVPDAAGLSFLARLMVRKMPLMNFPRYINQTPRDFFYLLRREILPGAPLSPSASLVVEPFGVVATEGNDFPPFVVAAQVQAAENSAAVVALSRFDAKELQTSGAADSQVVFVASPSDASSGQPEAQEGSARQTLYHTSHGFVISRTQPTENDATPLLPEVEQGATLCVDAAELLTVVEPNRQATDEVVSRVVAALACTETMKVSSGAFRLGSTPGAAGATKAGSAKGLFRRTTPWARSLYPETPVVPQSEWGLPQARPASLPD